MISHSPRPRFCANLLCVTIAILFCGALLSKRYHGYYFKVLKGQGPAAPMGEMDFVIGGAMIGGFALAAVPAEYRVTGVQTFIVGPDGIVYQKDLGPNTLKTFQSMDRYNPDKTWQETDDDEEDDSTN
jgi:Protein of unknown function (DUF2950)